MADGKILEVFVYGAEGIEVGLQSVEVALADNSVPLQATGEAIAKQILTNVYAGGNPPWPDITPETRRRRKGDKTAPALIDLGNMMAAATATEPGVPDSLYSLTENTLTMGVSRVDVNAHLYGNPRTNEPPRNFLQINEQQLEDDVIMTAAFDDYLGKLFEWTNG